MKMVYRVFLLLVVFLLLHVQTTQSTQNFTGEAGDMRHVFDAAIGAEISVNSTCGANGPEEYCSLLDISMLRPASCHVCQSTPFPTLHSSTSPANKNYHGVGNVSDDSDTWWQSSTLHHSPDNQHVTMTIDMKQELEVMHVTLRSGISPLPAVWLLERSISGATYSVWQYFVYDDSMCEQYFGIAATPGVPQFVSDTEIICTSYYTSLTPLQYAQLTIPLQAYRPSENSVSRALSQFARARYIRLRFMRLHQLELSEATEATPDDMLKHYFYSLSSLKIGAKCFCNGQADICSLDADGKHKCHCRNNTCGDHCEQCCPLYVPNRRYPAVAGESECRACQCNGHALSCVPDTELSDTRGVCVDCQNNTSGQNCELCATGFYRPLHANLTQACLPCTCRGAGSTSNCNQNNNNHRIPGECECVEGYGGRECQHCSPGFTGYPHCSPCTCHAPGVVDSAGGTACRQEHACQCKKNVDGERCDRCKPGYFSLQADNPEGCKPCFCSGLTDNCANTRLFVSNISCTSGWKVTRIDGKIVVNPSYIDGARQSFADGTVADLKEYFWQAPAQLTGSQVYSYGQRLYVDMEWLVSRGDTNDLAIMHPDVIIEGAGLRIGFGGEYYRTRRTVISALLEESMWYLMPNQLSSAEKGLDQWRTQSVSRAQLMRILTNIDRLLVRAKYHHDQIEGSLLACHLARVSELATTTSLTDPVTWSIERCQCPVGYSGALCDKCSWGYVRRGERCEVCPCHGHAATCDLSTGQCGTCEHHTTGEHCEHCLPGYYGNALSAANDSCRPCNCGFSLANSSAVSTNQVADICSSIEGGTDYVCNRCPEGHYGSHCERCSAGYYGDPTAGRACRRCRCHGNAQSTQQQQQQPAVAQCDPRSGQCVNCTGHRAGWQCHVCAAGYFGDAVNGSCARCECDSGGAVSGVCDHSSGQCRCRERYTTPRCDRCQNSGGNPHYKCLPCFCNAAGSVSRRCDLRTGQCTCKPGVTGVNCDQCRQEHFGFGHADGCHRCQCDLTGSLTSKCDIVSGQCECHVNVTGRSCNQCQVGHFNMTSGEGCQSCQCDPVGTVEGACDPLTGQCRCRSGFGGRHCDTCQAGHYRSRDRQCRKCARCDLSNHICHPSTGECVCPPHTEGNNCERCQAGFWNWQPVEGCQRCLCDGRNSVSDVCDPVSGQCHCFDGFGGVSCDRCAPGYHSYPGCVPCSCHVTGSLHCSQSEAGQRCMCRQSDGACTCKANVIGKKCDRCAANAFGLNVAVVDGCTKCFCFGRSDKCSQAPMVWKQVRVSSERLLSRSGDPSHLLSVGSLQVIPEQSGDLRLGLESVLRRPIYWQLSQQFLGDQVLSYGGYLRFRLSEFGGSVPFPAEVLSSHPTVQLHGNTRLILEFYDIGEIKSQQTYSVRLHESSWRLQNTTSVTVTREIMMVALQNIQHVLVRATSLSDSTESRIADVSWDIARLEEDSSLLSDGSAFTIELCHCPHKYNGTSCQNPSSGHYRTHLPGYLDSDRVTDLVGESTACQCHGRSLMCHAETGHCFNCTGNTNGPHCEYCQDGYYAVGNYDHSSRDVNGHYGSEPAATNNSNNNMASTGGSGSLSLVCSRCLCPSALLSNARSCTAGLDGGFRCHCNEGYTGQRCDRCAFGFYGNALAASGGCRRCDCSETGSRNSDAGGGGGCDPVTGQCVCRTGRVGRTCSHCARRHVLVDQQCRECRDGCVEHLFSEIDSVSQRVRHINATNLRATARWQKLRITNETRRQLEERLDQYQLSTASLSALYTSSDLTSLGDTLLIMLRELARSLPGLVEQARLVRGQLDSVYQSVTQAEYDAKGTTSMLHRYIDSAVSSVTIERALDEARAILSQLETRDFVVMRNRAREDVRRSVKLLQRLLSLSPLTGVTADSLTDQLAGAQARLHDVQMLLQQLVRQPLAQVATIVSTGWRHLAAIGAASRETEQQRAVTASVLAQGRRLVTAAHSLHQLTLAAYTEVRGGHTRLQVLNGTMGQRASLLQDLDDSFHALYVLPAQLHAKNLQKLALRLESLFSATRTEADMPLRAADAFGDIYDAIETARRASLAADQASIQAYDKLHPAGSDSMVKVAAAAKIKSEAIFENAETVRKQVADISGRLNSLTHQTLNTSNSTLVTVDESAQSLLDDLHELAAQDVSGEISEARVVAQKASDAVTKMASRIDHMRARIASELGPQSDLATVSSKGLLSNASATIEAVRIGLRRVDLHCDSVEQRRHDLAQVDRTLTDKLTQLQNHIVKARQAASNIKASLTVTKREHGERHNPCHRSYLVPSLYASTASRVRLVYSLDHSSTHQSVLFFVVGSNQKDFMSLDVFNRSVRFSWDNGGGVATITHPLTLETSANTVIWYSVQADRMGNIGRLTVAPSVGDRAIVSVTGVAPVGYTVLDVTRRDPVFVGPPPVLPPSAPSMLSDSFEGCLSELELDGSAVGLWNFRTTLPSCIQCQSKYSSATLQGQTEGVSFDGSGYSQLYPLQISRPSHRSMYSVVLCLKTLDDNALIFFTANPHTGQYVSLQLRDGRLEAQVAFTRQHVLVVSSRRRYSSGQWTTVELTKYKHRVILRVNNNGESLEAVYEPSVAPQSPISVGEAAQLSPDQQHHQQQQSLSTPGSELLLNGVPLYFGGVSVDVARHQWPRVVFAPLLGCLTDVQVALQSRDLTHGNSSGMVRGCSGQTVRQAAFDGKAYLEIDSQTLATVSSFGFAFRSGALQGLILLSCSVTKVPSVSPLAKHYFMAYVSDGRVAVQMAAGSGRLQIVSASRYNDSALHSVAVLKNKRRVELRVDDVSVGVASLPRGSSVIETAVTSGGGGGGGLYFGGVPPEVAPQLPTTVPEPFTGCIMDFTFDGKLVSFGSPSKHHRVTLGRCHVTSASHLTWPPASHQSSGGRMLSEMAVPRTAAAAAEAISAAAAAAPTCAADNSFVVTPGAVKFGDESPSFVWFRTGSQSLRSDFNLSISFRTAYADGVLLYSQAKRGHLSVALTRGSVAVSVGGGRVPFHFTAGSKLNDGTWRNVTLVKTKRKYTLLVDSFAPVSRKGPRKTRSSRRLYLAAHPDADTYRTPSGSHRKRLPKRVAQFRGCLRQLQLNGQLVQLAVAAAASARALRHCMSNVEAAAFFTGQSFATADSQFQLSDVFELELQFKTGRPDAVIVSAAGSQFGSPALSLELVDGEVVFSVSIGGSAPIRARHKFAHKYDACDNKWHTVRANFVKYQVTLKVDDGPERYGFVEQRRNWDDASRSSILYIGGSPEAVLNPTLSQSDNLVGCMKNVRIDGVRQRFAEMAPSVGVLLDSCPVAA